MKNKKVVKTFTVDEKVYNWLVETIKRADIGIGVSNILDGYLKYIYQGLREVLHYIEKKKINIPFSFVVHKYIDDHAVFFQYDWEAIKRLDKYGDIRKETEEDIAYYVNGLVDDFKRKHKGRWQKKPIKTEVPRVDREG